MPKCACRLLSIFISLYSWSATPTAVTAATAAAAPAAQGLLKSDPANFPSAPVRLPASVTAFAIFIPVDTVFIARNPVPRLVSAPDIACGFFSIVSNNGFSAFPSLFAPLANDSNALGTHSVRIGIMVLVRYCTPSLSGASMASNVCSCISSNALFMFAISPLRLSFIVSAISEAAPVELLNASSYPAMFSMPSFSIKFRPFVESAVNVAPSAAALSASPIPSVAFSTSSRISVRSRKLPCASDTATEVSPILIAPSSMLFVMSRITAVSAVPASEPL